MNTGSKDLHCYCSIKVRFRNSRFIKVAVFIINIRSIHFKNLYAQNNRKKIENIISQKKQRKKIHKSDEILSSEICNLAPIVEYIKESQIEGRLKEIYKTTNVEVMYNHSYKL